jgi:hypothetical protein
MADEFERRLERLFGEAPFFADAEVFAQGIEQRLDRGWNIRSVLIGTAGLMGGVVGVSQLLMSNFFQRMGEASEGSARALEVGVAKITPQVELMSMVSGDWGVVSLAGVTALFAMVFVLSRFIDEI